MDICPGGRCCCRGHRHRRDDSSLVPKQRAETSAMTGAFIERFLLGFIIGPVASASTQRHTHRSSPRHRNQHRQPDPACAVRGHSQEWAICAYRVIYTTSIRRKTKRGHNSHPISAEGSRPSPRRVPCPYNQRNRPNVPNPGSRSLWIQGRNPGARNSPTPITFLSRKVVTCFEGLPTNGTNCGAGRIQNEWSKRSTNSGIVPTRNEWSKRSTNSEIVPTRNEWSKRSTNAGMERRATRCW